jgi:three-Cys-motif partner protein
MGALPASVKPTEVTWPLDPHTQGKHEVLRQYLGAWFPILGSTSDRIVFIDGFAGPGEYKGGEKGSPLVALDVFRQHQATLKAEVNFFFIEKDPKRATYLQGLIDTLQPTLPKNCIVKVKPGAFDETMTSVLDSLDAKGTKLAPAFVMADPFGVSDPPMSVLERILKNEKAEVYVSFMYEYISRFKATPEFEKPLTRLFGTEEWRAGVDLQGDEKKDFFYGLYEKQLRKAGAKQVVHFDLYEGNRLVYAIFFASQSWLGADKMKWAIWKVVPFGDFAFRGTQSGQLPLFGVEPDDKPLRKVLQDRFRGKGWIPISRIKEFVGSDQTDYHTSHIKRLVLVPMEKEKLIEVQSPRKKPLFYPDGTKIKFL